MTLKPLRVNIQVREYLGNGKYGPSRSITLYTLTRDEVYDKIELLFRGEDDEVQKVR